VQEERKKKAQQHSDMMGGQGNMGSYKQSDWLAEEEQLSTGAGWTFINFMMSPIPTSHVFFLILSKGVFSSQNILETDTVVFCFF
jgi:hypothetical protein